MSEMVARRLSAALEARGLSKAEAARRLGWSQPNFNRQTNNQVKLNLDDLGHIEKTLGITTAYLMGEAEDISHKNRGAQQ